MTATTSRRPRSCGEPLTFNMRCSQCGRSHYNPANRKFAVRWPVGSRVRLLAGEHKGRMATVDNVGSERVYIRINLGTKARPDFEIWSYPPEGLRKSGR